MSVSKQESISKEVFKPREDDQHLFNIIFGLTEAQALFVAFDLKLFPLLAKGALSLEEVADVWDTQPRAVQALLSICASSKLIRLNAQGRYELTSIAEDYLLEDSPTYYGGILEQGLKNSEMFSFDPLKNAVLTNKSQAYGGKKLFETNDEQVARAKSFIRCMHSKSVASATAWPLLLDLSAYRTFLDVGGGSGAHSIGVCVAWPNLKAMVFDRPIVCEIANEFIKKSHLQERISTEDGDMFVDAFPSADLHFYCDVLHDWPLERCSYLCKKSFEALPSGGRIMIHEMLFNDDKTGPSAVSAYNIRMLLWTEGQQFSGKELITMLQEAGFVKVNAQATGFGSWSLVTGEKP